MDALKSLARPFKPLLSATILRPGRVVRIAAGPSKGLRYAIYPEFGLAPIYGGWEPELQAVAVQLISAGDVIYDVGGNYGIHAILFARLVGPRGRVITFEPLPDLADALERNVRLNKFENVECVREAVDERCGEASFVLGHHTGAGHLSSVDGGTATSREPFQVPVTSLDDLVFNRGYPPPAFIKIDIEGAEGAALRGARRVLETARPILVVDLHTPEQDSAVGRVLLEHDYRARRTDCSAWIERIDSPYPDPRGLYGQIVALPN